MANPFSGVGNFFRGIFGGNETDDERKKRLQQEAQQRQADAIKQQQAAKSLQQNQQKAPLVLFQKPTTSPVKPVTPLAAAPRPTPQPVQAPAVPVAQPPKQATHAPVIQPIVKPNPIFPGQPTTLPMTNGKVDFTKLPAPPKGAPTDPNSVQGHIDRGINTAAASTARVATGIVAAFPGLYDLLTPGKGTNRLSKSLDNAAKEIDKGVDDPNSENHGYHAGYKVGNVAGEALSYLIPSKGAASLAKAFPKGVKITDAMANGIANTIKHPGKAQAVRNWLGEGVKKGLSFEELVADQAISSKYIGENAGKGNDTNPASVLENVGTGILGNAGTHMAGSLVRKVAGKLFNRGGQKTQDVAEAVINDGKKVPKAVDAIQNDAKNSSANPAARMNEIEQQSKQRPLTPDELKEYQTLRQAETPADTVARHTDNQASVAAEQADVQTNASQKAQTIANDSTLTPEQKVAALKTAQDEYKAMMADLETRHATSQQAIDKAQADIEAAGKNAQDAAAGTPDPNQTPEAVLHLPNSNVYARISREQQQHLENEVQNIPWSPEDKPHLSPLNSMDKSGAKEVSLDELTQLSPNAKTAIDNAPAPAAPDAPAPGAPAADANTIQQATQAAELARGGKPNILRRFFGAARRELVRPNAVLNDLDRELAKSQGIKTTEIDPNRKLTALHQRVSQSNNEADALLKEKQQNGQSIVDLLHKYGVQGKNGENSPAWAEFNQFMNQRFALEVYQKSEGNMWILGKDFDPKQVAASVLAYGEKNPSAVNDAQTVKQWADRLTDLGVESGEIAPEFADEIKNGYQNYVPLSRTYSEDLVRPRMTGGTGASVGQQNVVRFLAGSNTPLDDSAGNFINRGRQIVKKANENRFVNELYARQQQGVHGDKLSLQIDPEVSARNREVSDLYDQAVADLQTSKGELNGAKRDRRLLKVAQGGAKTDVKLAEANAVGKVRQLLHTIAGKTDKAPENADPAAVADRTQKAYQRIMKNSLDENGNPIDQSKSLEQVQMEAQAQANQMGASAEGSTQAFGDVAPYANALTNKQALDLLTALNQYNPEQLRVVVSQMEKSNAKLAGLTDAVDELKSRIDAHRSLIADQQTNASGLWSEKMATSQRPKTGEQILRGFRGGDAMGIGINPEMAQQLEYLNTLRDDAVGKLSSAASAPLKIVATGAGAPVFAVKNMVRNQTLKFVNTDTRRTYGARAMGEYFRGGLLNVGQFAKDLADAGYVAPTATRTVQGAGDSAQKLAAHSGFVSKTLYDARHPREWIHNLNQFGGRLDNADRIQIARGEYQHWINKGADHATAIRYAADAANNALGNFQVVSKTARRLEALTPYSGATQAGYRSLVDALRERPVQTSVKLGALAGSIYGLAAWNLQHNDAANDYYKEQVDQGRTYDLDSNFVFVLPGAHRDPNTGQWTGIVKVPVAPDYAPLTRTAWRAAYGKSIGRPITPAEIATGVGNFATADEARTIHNGTGGINGFLPSSPVIAAISIGMNINPQNGKPLGDENDIKAGFNNSTSDFAKQFSAFTGGRISPLQADAIANQNGLIGDFAQDKPGNKQQVITNAFTNIFAGSKSKSDKALNYEDFLATRNAIKDEKQQKLFDALHTTRTLGKDVSAHLGAPDATQSNTGMLDGANRALILLSNEEVLNAEMKLAEQAKAQGKPVNPLLDPELLTDQERKAILTYRQGKIYNSAQQNKDANGQSAFTDLGLDEPWYQAFVKKENDFYKSLPGSKDDGVKTFSGYDKPVADPAMQHKLDVYSSLAKGTGDRSRFLNANPDVLDFWAKQNDFTNAERSALGFNQVIPDSGFGNGGGGQSLGLAPITGLGDNIGHLTLGIDKKATEPDLMTELQKLFAHSASGVSRIQLGAGSRGQG